jgi:hypothetical protein
MMPSPTGKRNLRLSLTHRVVFLASLTVAVGFAIGFIIGQSEDHTLQQWGLGKTSVTLVVEDSQLLNEGLIHLFETQTNLTLRVLKAQTFEDFNKFSLEADIWIARICWLERLALVKPTNGLVHESWAEKNISPDFLTFNHQEISSAPLFWNVGENLHVNWTEKGKENIINKGLPLFLIGIKSIDSPAARQAVDELTQRQFIQIWIETIPWATTYMSLDESLIEKYQKASFIRELPFQKLELVDANSPKCDININKSIDQKSH